MEQLGKNTKIQQGRTDAGNYTRIYISESTKSLLNTTISRLEKKDEEEGYDSLLERLMLIQGDMKDRKGFFHPIGNDTYEVFARFADTIITAREWMGDDVIVQQQLLDRLEVASQSSDSEIRNDANRLLELIQLPPNKVSGDLGDKKSDKRIFKFYNESKKSQFNTPDFKRTWRLKGFTKFEVYFGFTGVFEQIEKNDMQSVYYNLTQMSRSYDYTNLSAKDVFKNWFGIYDIGRYNILIPAELQ